MKAKITRYLIPLLIFTIIITFCSFSCSTPGPAAQTIKESAQETTEEITVEEPEEEVKEEVAAVEEPVVEEVTSEPEEEDIEAVEESSEEKEDLALSTLIGTLKVHFIDVGQGDSIFIELPSGNNILIDGGSSSSVSKVVSYLKNLGINRLNIVVGTHPHEDHIGGLIEVLNSFSVDNVIDSGVAHTSKTYQEYLNTILSKVINYIVPEVGDEFDLKLDTKMKIVGPLSPSEGDLNNSSIVFKLIYKNVSFLFAGDAEAELENQILQRNLDISSDILKVGHHGSSSASSIEFLRKVNPDIAIISCGTGNRYGHPHDITLNNLSNLGITIHRTDESGNIIVESDGLTYRVVEGDPFTYVEEKEQENEKDLSQEQQTDQAQEEQQQEEQQTYSIEVVSLISPINRGAQASITINTAPNVLCEITVYYKSGASKAKGLEPKNSDGDGNCTWAWKVGGRTTPGDWKIVLKAEGMGQIETYFTVTE